MKELYKKQPKALYILFFSELWERFGFYTVQSLMVLYLTNILGFGDKHSYNVAGGFGALLYLAPLIGGWLADRILGFQRAIMFGFVLYIAGYFMLDSHAEYVFYAALSLVIAGNGYFKANISSLLGTIYEEDDPRRDRGFTIFYMGINIGSLLGPICAAVVQKNYGYHAAFAMCGIGLLIGFIAFIGARKRLLGKHGLEPLGNLLPNEKNIKKARIWTYIITLIVSFTLICFALPHPTVVNYAVTLFSIAAVIYVIYEIYKLTDAKQQRHLIALIILTMYSVAFWAYYMQLFFSITLFTERHVDRSLFGWIVPTEAFATFPNIFLVLLSPLFIKLWAVLDRRNQNPSTSIKFALSMVFMALSFFVFNLADKLTHTGIISVYWVLFAGLIREVGELLISPIGLSAVTRLSPQKLTGTMMGLWFVAIGAGIAIAGAIASSSSVPKSITNTMQSLHIYDHAFWQYGYISLIIATISLLLAPIFNKLTDEKLFN